MISDNAVKSGVAPTTRMCGLRNQNYQVFGYTKKTKKALSNIRLSKGRNKNTRGPVKACKMGFIN